MSERDTIETMFYEAVNTLESDTRETLEKARTNLDLLAEYDATDRGVYATEADLRMDRQMALIEKCTRLRFFACEQMLDEIETAKANGEL